jgi:hypothetical protein
MNVRLRIMTAAVFAMLALVPCLALSTPRQDAAQPDAPAKPVVRFVIVDVFVDAGDRALAAYQVEFTGEIAGGSVKLVGIEGSGGADGTAYTEPPAYDPAALQNERVVIADYSTLAAHKLPHGNTRVARLHLMIEAPADAAPEYTVNLIAAATPDGTKIQAPASVVEGDAR